jgi:hypothetical protein
VDGKIKAFVNEWISQEDIEKYGLVALCAEYSKDDLKYTAVKNPNNEIDWTIDRKRGIWLMRVASATNLNYELPSPTQEKIFILHYLGVNMEVRLWWERVSKATEERPLTISWKYLGMNPNSIKGADEEELKAIVKEAIQVYRWHGLLSKETEITEVTFFDFEGGK